MAKKSVKKTSAKKSTSSRKRGFWASDAGNKTFILILCLIAFAGLVIIIKNLSTNNPGAQYGVGADGFTVFEDEKSDLGIDKVVEKPLVEKELGSLTKEIDDVRKTSVLNYNGNKGQTATYYLVTNEDTLGSFYVDVMEYKSQKAYDQANVFASTLDAGEIQGLKAAYMRATTIANEREYALLVSKGTKSYKFALTQQFQNVKIDEVTAQNALKRIAQQAHLK